MTAEEFAQRARESALASAAAQGFSPTVSDPDAVRLLRTLLRGGEHART